MAFEETCVMNERLRFIAAPLEDEETISVLCRRFGSSRKTAGLGSRGAGVELSGPARMVRPRSKHHRKPVCHVRAINVRWPWGWEESICHRAP